MADYFYGVRRGASDNPQAVVVGTASAGLPGTVDIELHINTTNGPTKKDVYKALEAIWQNIMGNGVATTAGTGVDQLPL